MSESDNHRDPVGRRARTYLINGIVLRRRNLGESDRILTVLSREVGKHRFVAKGVRRPGSRMAGHSEPFMIAKFLLARTRGLPIATQVETVQSFTSLRVDERAIATAGLIAERVDVFAAEDERSPGMYSLLEQSLALLDQGTNPERVQLIFDILLMQNTGFRPNLLTCVGCDAQLKAVPNQFVLERGGFLCEKCRGAVSGSRLVSVDVQKILRMIDRGDLGPFLGVRADSDLLVRSQALMSDYISSITGRESTASRVIRELRLEYSHRDISTGVEDDDGIFG